MFTPSNDDKKLDWMYKGATSLIDREEYLLGKCVDKTLEQAQREEKQAQKGALQAPKNHVEHECIPPSIRDYKQQIGEQVDLAAKLQEDPLVAIRKREEEARKKFLQNPVQLKKIQKALKEKDKKGKKKSKKKKHSKKKKSDSTDDSDVDLDAKLAEKFLAFKNAGKEIDENDLDTILQIKFSLMKDMLSEKDYDEIMEGKDEDSDSEQERAMSSEEESNYAKHKHKYKRNNNHSSSENEDRFKRNNQKVYKNSIRSSEYKRKFPYKKQNEVSSDESEENNYRKRKKLRRSTSKEKKGKKEEKKNDCERKHKDKMKHKEKPKRRHSTSSSSSDSSPEIGEKRKADKKNHDKNRKPSVKYSPLHKQEVIRKYNSDSDEIVEEKRNYGLISADGSKLSTSGKYDKVPVKSKDQKKEEKGAYNKPENKKRLTEKEKEKLRQEMAENAAWRYKDREKSLRKYREEDEKEIKELKDYDPNFMQKQIIKSTSSSTVESRIKSNINNIQRTSSAMNFNFSRK